LAGGHRASIVPLTGSFHQGFDEVAAGPAVAPGAARPLDLAHRSGSRLDGGLDGVIGDTATEAEDHRRGLSRKIDDVVMVRVAFRPLLGS
jgi:hypothetical protein